MTWASGGFLGMAAGIATAVWLELPPLLWLGLAGAAGAGAALILLFNRRGEGWFVLLVLFGLGGFWMSHSRADYRRTISQNQIWNGQILSLQGTAIERPRQEDFGFSCRVRLDPARSRGLSGIIRLQSPTALPDEVLGRLVRCQGRFRAAFSPLPGWPGPAEQQRVSGYLWLRTAPLIARTKRSGLPSPLEWANHWRSRMKVAGARTLKGLNLELLHAMLFGDRIGDTGAAARLQNELQRTGTIHLLSVSGLHVGLVAGFLSLLLRWLRVPERWRLWPLAAAIGGYTLMTGMEPPVLRAGLMLFFFLAGTWLGMGTRDGLNRLALAAWILLMLDPYALTQIGFQLSCGATLGVVWLFPLLRECFPAGRRWLRLIRDCLLISVAAQLPLLPILIHYFQQISWSGPIVNLFLLIPANLIVVGGLAGEALGAVFPAGGAIALTGLDWVLSLTRAIVHFWAGQPWAASYSPVWPWPWLLAYYLGLALFLDWIRPNRLTGLPHLKIRWGPALLVFLSVANLIGWTAYGYRLTHQCLQLTMIDVGQGDALLLKTPDGRSALIDCGNRGRGRRSVLPVLRREGIARLDQVYLSHGDLDHRGGLLEVLNVLPVGTLFLPAGSIEPELGRLRRAAERLGVRCRVAGNGTGVRLGRSVSGRIYEALEAGLSENDRSLVIALSFGKNKLLLTGDLSAEGEAMLSRKYPHELRAAVLKVGHHGSNGASTLNFLTQVRPLVGLISVGRSNHYGHPGPEALKRLRALAVPVYRTDRDGRIDLRLYSNRLSVTVARREKQR
jgi:competence protein ComEC